jgi:glycosyltransferase involved in cell wall biosynthesis
MLAPRGELQPGISRSRATALKKAAYRAVATMAGMFKGIVWQASSEHEAKDIARTIGRDARSIVVAPDLAPRTAPLTAIPHDRGPGSPLKVCFISRIAPKKNLDFALRALQQVRALITFDIFGPRESDAYWAECEAALRRLPPNVIASYGGTLAPNEVASTFAKYDLFLFPTRGENFGHVILESLRAGTPVLVANTTPWRDLERHGAGWDLPLDAAAFATAIDRIAALDVAEYERLRQTAKTFGDGRALDSSAVEANRRLFLDLVAR